MQTDRKRCTGILRPEDLLTKEGVQRAAGMGHEALMNAKRSGIVKALRSGKRVYFKGSELIEWILADAKR